MQSFTVECLQAPPPINTSESGREHIIGLLVALCGICAVDFLVVCKIFPGDPKTRWFALHAIVNGITVVSCLTDIGQVAVRPFCVALESTHSWVPSYCAFSLHLYHMLAFTALRKEDIVHHLLFAGVLGIFNFTFNWGRMTNILIFFMTGLPGGVDYVMLIMVKTGRLQRIHQKSICSAINTWVRVPGHVAVATLMASCVVQGVIRAPAWIVIIVTCLTLLNGLYYGEQAIGTFHRLAALSPTYKDKNVAGDLIKDAITS